MRTSGLGRGPARRGWRRALDASPDSGRHHFLALSNVGQDSLAVRNDTRPDQDADKTFQDVIHGPGVQAQVYGRLGDDFG
jgi:hypothetical protein